MLVLSKPQTDASGEFANATQAAIEQQGRVHPPTLIAAAARMAGTYLFRSFDLDLPGVQPGHTVISHEAAEQNPMLIQIAAGALLKFGIKIDDGVASRISEVQQQVRVGFLETQRKVEGVCEPIRVRHALTDKEAAQSVAVATALLIRHCAKVLDPSVAFAIAAFCLVEGSKTAPDPVRRI